MSTDAPSTQRDILIDGHVHLHRCFRWSALVDSARTNFDRAAEQRGLDDPYARVLLLCDDFGFPAFSSLRESGRTGMIEAGWGLEVRGETETIVARSIGGQEIHIIAGRQIRTIDGLEILAVCTDAELPDGRSLEETLDLVLATDAIPVMPWGFGKWIGRRGRLIGDLLGAPPRPVLLIGDNGGRLESLAEPGHFKLARQAAIPILAGSDPLPFPGEERRAGGYGSHVRAPFDPENACASMRRVFRSHAGRFVTFGRLERPARFLRNQVRMQLRKYRAQVRATRS